MEKRRLGLPTVVVIVCVLCLLALWAAAAAGQGPEERVLEKRTFIHYKKDHAKDDQPSTSEKNTHGDYDLLANGLRWRTPQPFFFNPAGSGLDATEVQTALSLAMDEWEKYCGDIFGELVLDSEAVWPDTVRGRNSFTFGPLPARVIAIANVWGYYSGPPHSREIVEVHVHFSTLFTWGNGEEGLAVMDLQNIATHELGHGAGLGDLYKTRAGEETMYGYSRGGEIKKRDLYTGDLAGIAKLYQE